MKNIALTQYQDGVASRLYQSHWRYVCQKWCGVLNVAAKIYSLNIESRSKF